MNISEYIVNIGANYTAELNCSTVCEVGHALNEAAASRLPIMAGIVMGAVVVLAITYRLMLKGRIEREKWFKHVFEPGIVALLISSIFLMEVFLYGVY